jgi:hypothetical protein
MTRRSFVLRAAVALVAMLAASAGGAGAMRLPTSTLTVEILSNERESSNREEIRPAGQPRIAFERTRFIAKARIAQVLATDHQLTPGTDIDIRYEVTVRQPAHPGFRVKPPLNVGETVTLTVFGGQGSFRLRN